MMGFMCDTEVHYCFFPSFFIGIWSCYYLFMQLELIIDVDLIVLRCCRVSI
uniref:Uncharacterized protein n=1 Tax=Manihot esculenta TaxID=3983 RepID=A0A2C9UXB6_MANES